MTLWRCAACFCLSSLAAPWAGYYPAYLGCMLLVPADSWPGVCTDAPSLHTWWHLLWCAANDCCSACCMAPAWLACMLCCPASSTLAFVHQAVYEPLVICISSWPQRVADLLTQTLPCCRCPSQSWQAIAVLPLPMATTRTPWCSGSTLCGGHDMAAFPFKCTCRTKWCCCRTQ